MKLKPFVRKVYHGCWYLTAALIIILAVSISVVRLSLPEISRYKSEIESRVGDYLGSNISIDEINARWQAWSPILELNGISVNQQDSDELLFQFMGAEIQLDLIKSIKKGKLHPRKLTLQGLDLTIIRQQDASIVVVQTGSSHQKVKDTGLTQWLLEQQYLNIEDLTLHFQDEMQRFASITTRNNSIILRNHLGRTQIDGASQLEHDNTESTLTYAVDLKGDVLGNHWSGQLYLQGEQLQLGVLEKLIPESSIHFGDDKGNFTLWTSWQDSIVTDIDGLIDYPSLQLSLAHGKTISIADFHASLQLQRIGETEFSIALYTEDMEVNNISWQPSSWQSIVDYSEEFSSPIRQLHIDYLNLEGLMDDFSLLSNPAANFKDLSISKGTIHKLSIRIQEDTSFPNYDVDFSFNNLAIQYGSKGKAEQLDGNVNLNSQSGELQLDSNKSRLFIPKLASSDLELEHLITAINWQIKENTIYLNMPSLDLGYYGFSISGFGNIIIDPEKEDPFFDLYTSINADNVTHFIEKFPNRVLPKTFSWLKKSVLSGQIDLIEVLIRGPKNGFPYLKNEGRFQMIAKVNDVDVQYLNNWPSVDNLTGDILLNEEIMTVYVDSGKLFDAEISNVRAEIPNTRSENRVLLIEGLIDSSTNDTLEFIDNSPLKKLKQLSYLRDLGLSGQLTYRINLDVPLQNKDKSKRQTEIKGTAVLKDHKLDSERFGIQMESIKGELDFTRSNLTASNIQARYFGKDILIDIKETDANEYIQRKVILSGPMDQDFLKKQFNHYFPTKTRVINRYLDYFSGNSVWLAQLDISDQKNLDGKRLDAMSDLQGMTIQLPGPLTKKANDKLDIMLTTLLDNQPEKFIDVQIGSIFASRFDYQEGKNKKLESLNMIFSGSIDSLESKDGMNFSGRIARLNLSKWIELIRDKNNDETQKDNFDYSALSVKVDVNQLDFFGQTFDDVTLTLKRPAKDWLVTVEADAIAGAITIPEHQQSVIADLKHLHIKQPPKEKAITENSDMNPAEFPAIHAFVKKLNFDDMDLGEVYLETSRVDQGISIDLISFFKQGLTIDGYGSWLNQGTNNSQSEFIIDVASEKLDIIQDTFKYQESGIENGKTDMTIKAHWQGPPMAFSFEKMAGTMEIHIAEGNMVNIDPKAGRLFGLLSIPSLPKRLLLDFSDIFGKGFPFENITGVFDFEHGHAYTSNLAINSSLADISISGRTGLVDRDYDQLVTVTPKANDTLPVAGALFGPIGIGLGAVIYFASEVFDSMPLSVNRILEHQYTITGSWDDPIIEKISDEKEKPDKEGIQTGELILR